MFLGQYEHTIDEKGRMTIPVGFRSLLEAGAYITQGFDQNLMVLPAAAFEQFYHSINQTSITDPVARRIRWLLLGNASSLEIDKAGRILIPGFLRQAAGLDDTAMVIGVGSHCEVWSPASWKEQLTALQDPEVKRQGFSALDLSLK